METFQFADTDNDYVAVATKLVSALAQPHCGFLSSIDASEMDVDEPSLTTVTAVVANRRPPIHGFGTGLTLEEAFIPAIVEAVERHATATFYNEQFIWLSAETADHRVLDLDTVPRCSEREISDPRCPLKLPTKKETIRWVRGLCLHTGEVVSIPAVMVFSHAGWRVPQERFWFPISTGCAAHESYERAVWAGICEVVERDAIALVWLQQLALPRILPNADSPISAPYWDLCRRGNAEGEYYFFDATTDLGIPTIYGVQVSPHHPYAHTIVACSAAATFDQALVKVIKDLISLKRAFTSERNTSPNPTEFKQQLDRAAYMAKPEHASAFDFLLKSDRIGSARTLSMENPVNLGDILRRLADLKMQILAVDLTTDEALRAGLRVVRVIIPELQPFSSHTGAQFLAHPRLYHAPEQMGYEIKDEAHLNPWPQPFA